MMVFTANKIACRRDELIKANDLLSFVEEKPHTIGYTQVPIYFYTYLCQFGRILTKICRYICWLFASGASIFGIEIVEGKWCWCQVIY